MPKSGVFYTATESLADQANEVFKALEADDDLDALADGLLLLINRATEIRDATINAASYIREL